MSTVALPTATPFKSSIESLGRGMRLQFPSSLASLRSISRASSLKSSDRLKASATAVHKVKLIGPEGEEREFDAPDDAYILDAAERAGLELPFTCRVGACSICASRLASGSVDQSDGSYLDESQMAKGYVLTCVSYPTSDCVIHTHKEVDLY